MTFLNIRYLLRGAFRHDSAAPRTTLRTDINNVIRTLDHIKVVFHQQHRVPAIHQSLQYRYQPGNILIVQPDRRLINQYCPVQMLIPREPLRVKRYCHGQPLLSHMPQILVHQIIQQRGLPRSRSIDCYCRLRIRLFNSSFVVGLPGSLGFSPGFVITGPTTLMPSSHPVNIRASNTKSTTASLFQNLSFNETS